mmetsp:Transcript_7358/g.8898  ORF Transcript_7358/g.8898 Transcript_7358/m.8898 type:complete len:336 (+) Transcript_7358:73-1080(+)
MSETISVPIIDLQGLDNPEKRRKIVKQVDKACQKFGFFQIINHGISKEVIKTLDEALKEFFLDADLSLKKSVSRSAKNPRGWFNNELTKQTLDFKECFDVGFEGKYGIDGENRWPNLPIFKKTIQTYLEEVNGLAFLLLGIMAEGIGLESHELDVEFKQNTSFMRLNYYPVCEGYKVVDEAWKDTEPDCERDGVLGINKHTDAGALTVLYQRSEDPASLQVYSRDHKRFIRVVPEPDSFTINIGDMMQVWSNDRYQSPIHRVLANKKKQRFTVPYFLNPSYSSQIQSKARVPGAGESLYTPFTWGEFRQRRFAGDFSDEGSEVQISDWKIKRSNL